ncbi:hypothetical protein K1719_045014 [Acacia pycnantha]|nr:hypothetical protein K1719_045014 [Acacia pycnantha]
MMNPLPPFDDEDSFFQISVLNNRSSLSIQTIPEHESFHYPAEKVNNFGSEEVIPKGKGKQKKQNEFSAKIAEDGSKKWIHRETERQRRQEMATLCASLRSSLPLEYIRESDIYGSTTYYSELQRKLTAEILSTEHR